MTNAARYFKVSTSGKMRTNLENALRSDNTKMNKLLSLLYKGDQVRSKEELRKMLSG
jgi:hypothetical protein